MNHVSSLTFSACPSLWLRYSRRRA